MLFACGALESLGIWEDFDVFMIFELWGDFDVFVLFELLAPADGSSSRSPVTRRVESFMVVFVNCGFGGEVSVYSANWIGRCLSC